MNGGGAKKCRASFARAVGVGAVVDTRTEVEVARRRIPEGGVLVPMNSKYDITIKGKGGAEMGGRGGDKLLSEKDSSRSHQMRLVVTGDPCGARLWVVPGRCFRSKGLVRGLGGQRRGVDGLAIAET